LVGQPVVVQHQNGQVSRGILRQADERGVYLQPTQGAAYVSLMKQKAEIAQAVATEADTAETEPVWFGAWFLILYALIAGLAFAGAAGAYGGYGYGRGYGGGYGVRPFREGPYGRRTYFY
jgi:hypothetical protein